MELPSKLLEQIAFNTRPKTEGHMLIVMNKSKHQEHLSQLLQTNNKQFKIAVTFLNGYNGLFNVTHSKNYFCFNKALIEENFIQIIIPPGAYEMESLNNKIKRIIIDKSHYTEDEYPFTIQPNFSTLGSIIEILPRGPIFSFVFDDSIRNLLGFHETILDKKYNLSHNRVDILSFDNIFLDCDFAREMIFEGKRIGILHKWTMTVDPSYEYVEKFAGGFTWYIT